MPRSKTTHFTWNISCSSKQRFVLTRDKSLTIKKSITPTETIGFYSCPLEYIGHR